MKILHISTAKTWRGGENQIINLMKGLRERNVEQLLFCSKGSKIERRAHLESFRVESKKRLSNISPNYIFGLYRIIKKHKPTILHAHDAHAHTAVVFVHRLFSLKQPIIVHRRIDFEISQRPSSIKKYTYSGIKQYICVSDVINGMVSKVVSPSKVVTVHSAIALECSKIEKSNRLRTLLSVTNDVQLVGNISALADHKDIPTFVKTVKAFVKNYNSDNVLFVWIGDGDSREEMERLIHQSSLGEKIQLTGYQENAEELYRELDCFLMTSKTEGLGTTVLSAFSAGVPVVATNGGGLKEICIDRQSALVSEVGDAESLANAVYCVLSDKQTRSLLIDGAHQLVKNHTVSVMTDKTIKVYSLLSQV